MRTFQESILWKKNLAARSGDDAHSEARDRLRNAFLSTRSYVTPLVAQIGKELPNLTAHDITHLDHLWHIADALMGPNFAINPAETFVLGMTFLLHDAATSTFAFPRGIEDLCETEEWQDIVAQSNFNIDEMAKGARGYQRALFETLRLLHPRQAETLLTQSWKDLNGNSRWLLNDLELRNHYGRTIGKIAASHGKDITIVEQEWARGAPITPHSCLSLDSNADWKVDCFKVALILRCSDAAHIDSRRAPDMLAALTSLDEESKKHWLFQNRLGDIGINERNEVYWSGQAFEEKDADAWWLCFSTAKMVDQEIRTSNRLLINNQRSSLRATGVMGVLDLNVFQENVPVQGWQPLDINFQVSQVSDIIEKFGGEKLYGKNPSRALRELIQNAADSIRALRLHRNKPSHGEIFISLSQDDGSDWLHVQDNGIGMSRYVLTDVLLDFGRSLWKSSTLREQWRGLAGKGFEAMGKFGIGFFSVFMLGDEVKVTTWRNGDSEEDQNTLHIRNRTNAKPILVNTPQNSRLNEFGTRVSIRLKNGRDTLLPSGEKIAYGEREPEETLSELIGVLAPAIDIDISCQDIGEEKKLAIRANDWKILEPAVLIKRMHPRLSDGRISKFASDFHDILESDNTLVGRACIHSFSTWDSTGGVLVHKGISVGECSLIGIWVADNNQDLARKTGTPICSKEALRMWGGKILEKNKSSNSPSLTRKLLSIGIEDKDLPIGEKGDEYISQIDILKLIENENEVVVLSEYPSCPSHISELEFDNGFVLADSILECNSLGRDKFGLANWIENLLPDSFESPRTIESALSSIFGDAWGAFTPSKEERIVGTVDDEDIESECLVFSRKIAD